MREYIKKSLEIAGIKGPSEFLEYVNNELSNRGILQRNGIPVRYRRSAVHSVLWRGGEYSSKAVLRFAYLLRQAEVGIATPRYPIGWRPDGRGHANILWQNGVTIINQSLPPNPIYVENSNPNISSSRLVVGNVYTRKELKQIFSISDATINNGVFRPDGFLSIWLFITEKKTVDRTQYVDRVVDDVIHWNGQTQGRTDQAIIRHERNGIELLVFHRRDKSEHPGAGFRYLGQYAYVSHNGSNPTDFLLRRRHSARLDAHQADVTHFDPDDVVDMRIRINREIAQRRGQQAFRNSLRVAYGNRCAVSGSLLLDLLEAAHITPYLGAATNTVDNGLLLRSDIHTLFDCGLLAVDPDSYRILLQGNLMSSEYGCLHGQRLNLPSSPAHHPSRLALKRHLDDYGPGWGLLSD
ncbi:DUF3427 domain-containing protein [Mesorhizobium sp. M1252]|uniref:HNH endonuclease n=1 Tax=Mesorhizobium sp. M1252 TaxID=2957073 RepID=UPI00333B9319